MVTEQEKELIEYTAYDEYAVVNFPALGRDLMKRYVQHGERGELVDMDVVRLCVRQLERWEVSRAS